MLRYAPALMLTLSVVAGGCQPSPTTSPDDTDPPPPVTQSDPIAGDPTDIEGEEIGEDMPDNARLVGQGPAEAAVNTGESMDLP